MYRSSREALFFDHDLFILLFFYSLLLGGKRKWENNNQSCGKKTMHFCLIKCISFYFPFLQLQNERMKNISQYCI